MSVRWMLLVLTWGQGYDYFSQRACFDIILNFGYIL